MVALAAVVAALLAGIGAGAPTGAAADEDTDTIQVAGTYSPVATDFDGDGFVDILWYGPGRAPDSIWFGSADGWGQRTTRTVRIDGSYRIVTGDFDGDGQGDVLFARTAPAASVLWRFDGMGGHRSTTVASAGGGTPLVGRFNGDATDDILWYGKGSAPDSIQTGVPAGGFQTTAIVISGTYTPAVGDFDNNGTDDVLWGRGRPGSQPLWLSTGAPLLGCGSCFVKTSQAYAGTGSKPVAADVDGDGFGDVLWYGAGSASDALWLGRDAGFTSKPVTINGTYTPIVREAYSQDQIVWYSAAGPETDWFYNSAAGRFASEPFPSVGPGRIPLVGPARGPFVDEDVFFYGPGAITDLQTYVSDDLPKRRSRS